jgi:hypothetical protein
MSKIAGWLAPIALFAALTAVMTWPQVTKLGTAAADHQDVYFNMWRLGWVAHAAVTAPSRLLDGNIFYPEQRTLTFSDAMPVEAALAAPLLWARVPPVLVHNLVLLGGIVLSAFGMFVLARRLTGSAAAGVTAGFVFAFAPYRFEHYMHMELQWTVWMPWTFWALHRTTETARRRDGALVGLFVALQFLSSIYYGAFLAVLLVVVGAWLLCALRRPRFTRSLTALTVGGALALALVSPYALQYAITKNRVGGRPEGQVLAFSARPSSYTVATDTNFLYGERALDRGRAERRLFTGILPVLLAVAGLLLLPPSNEAVAFLLGLVLAFEMSLGFYGYSYPLLYHHVPIFDGLRAPARLGIFVVFFLALLAAYGHAAIEQALPRKNGRHVPGMGPQRGGRAGGLGISGYVLAVAICAVLMLEYWVAPLRLVPYPNVAPPLHAWLARQPRGVVAEMPIPAANLLPGDDPRYAYLSTFHWMPSINGYSGYYPVSYLDRLQMLQNFPADQSTRVLERAGVQYVIVHTGSYSPDKLGVILTALAANRAYTELGSFHDGRSVALVYRLH